MDDRIRTSARLTAARRDALQRSPLHPTLYTRLHLHRTLTHYTPPRTPHALTPPHLPATTPAQRASAGVCVHARTAGGDAAKRGAHLPPIPASVDNHLNRFAVWTCRSRGVAILGARHRATHRGGASALSSSAGAQRQPASYAHTHTFSCTYSSAKLLPFLHTHTHTHTHHTLGLVQRSRVLPACERQGGRRIAIFPGCAPRTGFDSPLSAGSRGLRARLPAPCATTGPSYS